MSSGNVIVKVGTADRLIPVRGAKVFVAKRNREKKDSIFATRVTDRNGETTNVSVETPDRIQSEIPGNLQPFTTVDIRIEHPEFYPYYIIGAQIFAETQSIQNVNLIPLAIPSERRTDNVYVTPQNL